MSIATVLILTIGAPTNSAAQDLQFKRFTVADGLSQGTIRTMLQDHKGFVWLGTQDGLNRFDGYEFEVFRSEPGDSSSLSNNWIETLFEDSQGQLWVGSIRGLNRLRKNGRRFDRLLPTSDIVAISEDAEGAILVGTTRALIRSKSAFESSGDAEELARIGISALHLDPHGNTWFGTNGSANRINRATGAIQRFDFAPFDVEGVRTGVPLGYRVEGFADGHDGRLYAATRSGLFAFDYERREFERATGSGPANIPFFIEALNASPDGYLWLGSGRSGLFRYDPTSKRVDQYVYSADRPNSITNDLVLSVLVDDSGGIWAGSLGGVARYDPHQTVFHLVRHDPQNPASLSSNFIWSIAEDSAGRVWIGTFDAGLSRMAAGEISRVDLVTNEISAIYVDQRQRLWLGSTNHITVYEPDEDRLISFSEFFSGRDEFKGSVKTIVEDSSGSVWIGTTHALYRVNPDEEARRLQKVLNGEVVEIEWDDDGSMWLGGTFGLKHFDPRTNVERRFHHDTDTPTSLSANGITSLHTDATGTLWIATRNGLNRFEKKDSSFTRFTVPDGLPSSYIYGIAPESDSVLWLSTNNGLSRFSINSTLGQRFRNFGIADGLQGAEFNTNAYLRASDGMLYFGGTNGLNYFHPTEIGVNPNPPSVLITTFSVFDREVDFETAIDELEEIQVEHDENGISFGFTAVGFSNPDRNTFLYKLEGFDPDWVRAGQRRVAYYTNLDPGPYRFRVRASNDDGSWEGVSEASVSLTVRPSLLQTWWFRSILIVSLLGVIFVFVRARLIEARRRQEMREQFSQTLIESQEEERARLARELHDGLGQNLLLIKGGIERSIQNDDTSDELKDFSDVAQETIDLIRQISDDLHPAQLKHLGLSSALQALAGKLSRILDANIRVNMVDLSGVLAPGDEIHVYRIVQEALSNAIRHSGASAIELVARQKDDAVAVMVKDNGSGFEQSTPRTGGRRGFGLESMSARARIVGADLTVTSNRQSGTTVQITLPKRGS